MEIIPAIDIIDGKCVRLTQGDYRQKKVYNEDPLEVARMFEGAGMKRLHLVDLDGARAKHIVNYKVLRDIASGVNMTIDFGGGLKTDEDLRIAFENGASMVTGGSIAVKEPALFLSWLREYGAGKIILGADHRKGRIAVSGWTSESDTGLFSFIENYVDKGIEKIICTDIERDGMLQGPSTELYAEMLNRFPGIQLIASGGISSVDDLEKLENIGIHAAITGKAIYEGKIPLKELRKFIK